MKIKQLFALVLAAAMMLSLSACRNRNDEEENLPPEVTENDELVIYHNSKDLAPGLISLTEEYSRASGKKVSAKLYSADFSDDIKSGKAALYVVDTKSDLEDWHSGGFFADLMNDSGFSNVITKIPAGLQLNNTGLGSYGIPLMLEGYGYIFDRSMLESLFEGETAKNLVNDLKTCSYSEFESFVTAVETYISAPSAAKITVNGNDYTFRAEKSEKAKTLTGVFSMNYESAEAAKALLSTALASKFAGRYEVMNANEETVSSLEKTVSAYIEVLDLHTRSIAGVENGISKGEEFSGGDYNYSTAIDLFAKGNALFYPGSTSDAADFEKSRSGIGAALDILPMKLPLSDEDITAAGMTKEKLDRSIVIGSRYYLAVNPKAEENLSAAAKEFISWLYEDEAGKTAYSGAFGAIPHSFEYFAESAPQSSSPETESGAPETENPGKSSEEPSFVPSHRVESSLLTSVGQYYAAGNWIPDVTTAMPKDWNDSVLFEGLSDFFKMENWTDEDRKGFSETLLGGWKDRLENKTEQNVG
ncbi:MAG: extracellular solute-binding protein [Oscillospiraceae bacterium]|nr:extracellular solute-binding protein [Oscillospiraceae bacterium]